MPEPVKRKLAKKGNVVSYRRGPLLACAFEDSKHVVILSTHGTGCIVEHESKYNKYMGGVDLADMRIYFFKMKGSPNGGIERSFFFSLVVLFSMPILFIDVILVAR